MEPRAVSRFLYPVAGATAIPPGQPLLTGSSDLPESRTERAAPPLLFGLAPHGVYPAGPDCSGRGALLPHLFTLTRRHFTAGRYIFCGTFRRTRVERIPPAVSRHAALWRPDFPLARPEGAPAAARPRLRDDYRRCGGLGAVSKLAHRDWRQRAGKNPAAARTNEIERAKARLMWKLV